ncbi:galactose-1-phosphate uridylyltransferase [Candidatus Berkelbacteria bacterium]|nr:galactose-1-phosphate uridylyltransferase [Candidatus Berkelbacteria bacterium]
MPQLRQNIVTGEWVVIAPERAKRPTDYIVKRAVRTDAAAECNFCIHGSAYLERLPSFETERVYVIPNKYPAFLEDSKRCSSRSAQIENGFYTVRPSTGGHDVVIIKEHAINLPEFTPEVWHDLNTMIQKRVEYFYTTCNVVSVMPIYNHRNEAGASILHPHAQIFASNVVPNTIGHELHGAKQYFEKNGACVFCDLITHERELSKRIVFESETFIAFTFYAARFPFEIWLLPKGHSSRFEGIDGGKLAAFGEAMRQTLGALDQTLDDPPLNYAIHTLPASVESADHYHWHVEITPRLSTYGGFEIGSGMIIDVMSPEDAAKYLKDSN